MGMQIQRGRQFLGGAAPEALFDASGRRGGWLEAAAAKLVGANVTVRLLDAASNMPVELTTAAHWDAFLAANVPGKDATEKFAERFGITFQDFIEVVDDAASAGTPLPTLDLSPASALSRALSLDTVEDDYASQLKPDAPVDLGGGSQLVAAMVDRIGPDILGKAASGDFSREFPEQESWADFVPRDGANRIFRENTGPAPFVKLYRPNWNDSEAMAVVNAFTLPLYLEVSETNPDGTPEFQDNNEMFRETYYDDANGSLGKAGVSVRARVRFDDDDPTAIRRVLLQGKSGREVDPATGQVVVTKFENRWEGRVVPEAKAQQALLSGHLNGEALTTAQKIYELAQAADTLPPSKELRLEPQHLVLQRRRRTHLWLTPRSELKERQAALTSDVASRTQAGQPVPPELKAYLEKVGSQIALMDSMDALLSKYGMGLEENETFIVSADRYSVYDPASRAELPVDVGDDVGRVGAGLHVEAEWDGAHAINFKVAFRKMEEQLAANPSAPKRAELEADREMLTTYRDLFRADVSKTVELMKNRLLAAGLESDPTLKSKEERASAFMAETGNRPTYWL